MHMPQDPSRTANCNTANTTKNAEANAVNHFKASTVVSATTLTVIRHDTREPPNVPAALVVQQRAAHFRAFGRNCTRDRL